MGHKIVICGGNGAGKTTLGRMLAQRLGWPFFDVEDYYFPRKDADYVYGHARTRQEVAELLTSDLRTHENMLFAAVKGDYGEEAVSLFTGAIWLCAPKPLRMARVRERSFRRFGERMLPGGDLFAQEQRFFDMVEGRTEQATGDWLAQLSIPVLRLEADRPPEQSLADILRWLE